MFLDQSHISIMGFKSVGKNVLISNLAVFYNIGNISIGDNSRVDDFCILSAGPHGIDIGRYVHIGCYSSILGRSLVKMADYSALSPRVSVYSSTDNYDGKYMTNPTIPDELRRPVHGAVNIGKHVIIGTNCIIMPGVTLKDGSCVWAMTMVTSSMEENSVVYGIPGKRIKERSKDFYEYEKILNDSSD